MPSTTTGITADERGRCDLRRTAWVVCCILEPLPDSCDARGSRLDVRLGQLNLICNAGQGLVAVALALSTNMAGIPALAFAASGLLLVSVPLYFVKKKDPRLIGVHREGSHVDEESIHRRTSRWPYTVVYTVGYIALFAYIMSIGLSAL
jgi:hypothetical protein